MRLTAPAAIRAQLREGLALVREGYAGRGLRGETVRWAERLARGEPVTLAKARQMRAWFARHGVARAESARRLRDPRSPSAVAYRLWGGDSAVPYRRTGWRDPVAAWLRDVLGAGAPQRVRRASRRARRNGSAIEVVDTRAWDFDGDRWRPVPGSGDPRPCSCCGRLVTIHVFVGGVLYGDRCARARFPSVTAKSIATARDTAIEETQAARLRAVLIGRVFRARKGDAMAQQHDGRRVVDLRRTPPTTRVGFPWMLVLDDGWTYAAWLRNLAADFGVNLG